MAETHSQKRVNHHRVKNEATPGYREGFQEESKGESPMNRADYEKEQTLKNIENSENPGCWIDHAEMDDMVKDPHPNPEKGEDSSNDPRREFAFTKGQGESSHAEQIRQHLGGPDGCIVASEDVEELLNRERYFQGTLLISMLSSLAMEVWMTDEKKREDEDKKEVYKRRVARSVYETALCSNLSILRFNTSISFSRFVMRLSSSA